MMESRGVSNGVSDGVCDGVCDGAIINIFLPQIYVLFLKDSNIVNFVNNINK